ncbi:MAG: S41 family peptidase [Clostridia bacterium]|nr:S41 family peptidase [Clostridia bacterium]
MKLYSIRSRMSGGTDPQRQEEDRIVHVNGVLILLIAVLLIAATALVSFLISSSIYKNKLAKEKAYKLVLPSDSDPYKVAKFQDIIDYISSNFALEYKTDDLIEGAINGYVDALGDRYSYYIEPGDYTSYSNYITGTYSGIGISCTFGDEGIVVNEVFPDTPAARAGISEGELITEINGITTVGMESSMVSSMLGQEGTKVKLKIVGVDLSEREVELEVATISRQSVFGLGYDDGVYYIRISQFDSDTGEEFRQMLKVAENAGMKALVLDLRGNPGGYERQADEVADALLGKGLIAYSQDKDGNRASEVFSDEKEVDVPVVLLVNQNSASASELVAGAFRDFKKGTIVGKRTFGKAIGQLSRSYTDDGSGVVITVARYFTPSGECIHGVGIAPDVEVSLESGYENLTPDKIPAGADAQLDKALELVKAALGETETEAEAA